MPFLSEQALFTIKFKIFKKCLLLVALVFLGCKEDYLYHGVWLVYLVMAFCYEHRFLGMQTSIVATLGFGSCSSWA